VDQFGLNGWQFVIQLVAFLIFIWLLWRFAVGPIVKILDERQVKIRESLASAERMQQELKATQARNEEVLLEARREAQDIVANARQSGEQLLAKARDEANVQAETYLTRAQETMRQETEQARQQLRSEVVDIATLAAGRILKKELNPEAQRQLIEETLSGASQASQN
jgi:F-type H+-transporting ATPase subunit b